MKRNTSGPLRRADIGGDHTLVLIQLKLKLRKMKRGTSTAPSEYEQVQRSNIQVIISTRGKNCITILRNKQQLDIEEFQTGNTLVKAGKKLLGMKKGRKNGNQQRHGN